MSTIDTPTAPFMRAMDRYMEGSRRPREQVMRIQAKGILKTVISITPPSDGTTTGTAAKKKGEQAIQSDLKKLFRSISDPKAAVLSMAEMKDWHESHRSSNGRVHGHGKDLVKSVRPHDLAAYLKIIQAEVGYLVSGWAAAARELGVPMPQWMTRNHAPSSVRITSNSTGISIRATNAAPFAANVKDLERRLSWAVKSQQGKIERQIAAHEEQLQREAGVR